MSGIATLTIHGNFDRRPFGNAEAHELFLSHGRGVHQESSTSRLFGICSGINIRSGGDESLRKAPVLAGAIAELWPSIISESRAAVVILGVDVRTRSDELVHDGVTLGHDTMCSRDVGAHVHERCAASMITGVEGCPVQDEKGYELRCI